MTDKLKPCPFCGLPAVLKETPHIPHGTDYTPQCIDPSCCGRLSKKFTAKATAISFWNRRADNDRYRKVDRVDKHCGR